MRMVLAAAATTVALAIGAPVAAAAQPSPTPPGGTSGPGQTQTSPMPPSGTEMHGMPDVLHGEGIVQTTKGPVHVAIQHGTVSQITGSTVTVRSSDGYTKTWQTSDHLKVLSMRNSLQPAAVSQGSKVFIGGVIQGIGGNARYTARIVLLHDMQSPGMGSPGTGSPTSMPTPAPTTS
ncbi:hypothetical protein [Dactylosporangium sp. CA-233914]|uniref:hypothetical protein n=1 Tax=Dactylosporangium sp. CA-233914 TaxID=3239934 RepID=UPI003D943AA9